MRDEWERFWATGRVEDYLQLKGVCGGAPWAENKGYWFPGEGFFRESDRGGKIRRDDTFNDRQD